MHAHEYLDGRRQLALPDNRRVVVATPAPPPPLPPVTMSIRGEEMADEVDEDGVRVDLSWRSNVCSCSMKWKLGETSGLRARTREKASFKHNDLVCIRYANVTVTLLETPAKQCTNTATPFKRASSAEKNRERAQRLESVCQRQL